MEGRKRGEGKGEWRNGRGRMEGMALRKPEVAVQSHKGLMGEVN